MAGHRTRARDSDRDEAIEFLKSGYADGQISFEEFQKRSDRVVKSKTLGEIDAYIQDLQVPGVDRTPPILSRLVPTPVSSIELQPAKSTSKRANWLLAGFAAAAVALGGYAIATNAGDESEPASSAQTADQAGADAFTPEGFTEIVDAVKDRTGGTVVREMLIFPSGGGNVSVPHDGSVTRTASYVWEGDQFSAEPSYSTTYGELNLIDLAEIDASSLPAAAERARELIDEPDEVVLHVIHQAQYDDRDYCYTAVATNKFNESGTAFVSCDGEITDTSLSPEPG